MGFGWIAYGFGLAFFFAILTMGYISAHVNPAMCLGLLVVGKINGVEFICLALSEFAGMFVGAVFVYLHFLPHFKTVPEPMSKNESDNLLRTRDALRPEQLNFVSYNTRDEGRRQQGPENPVLSALHDVRYYLSPDVYQEHHIDVIESAIGTHRTAEVEHDIEGALPVTSTKKLVRRRSIQVADLHKRLKNTHLEDELKKMRLELRLVKDKAKSTADIQSLMKDPNSKAGSDGGKPSSPAPLPPSHQSSHQHSDPHWGEKEAQQAVRVAEQEETSKGTAKRIDALFQAAITADQNAKLSVFATRPAIPSPIFNWLAEMMGTVMLIGGAFLVDFQVELMYKEFVPLFAALKAFYVGLMIQLIILGLGGPTGVAINPARDFSPRLAHQLLPIPGKGSSEWFYAWIPFTASFVGGAIGALLAKAINSMNHSQIEGAFYELIRDGRI
eukprot:jgi/Botrbrau1/19787/Bobra.0124s0035.1